MCISAIARRGATKITPLAFRPRRIFSNRPPRPEAGDVDTLYLVLPAGTLTAGGFYQFQLSAQYASGTGATSTTSGYSVLAVQVNAPPSSGTIAVTVRGGAPVGVVLQDKYDLACSGWVDDLNDLPLLYRHAARRAPCSFSRSLFLHACPTQVTCL
jgi:hypothetical protein